MDSIGKKPVVVRPVAVTNQVADTGTTIIYASDWRNPLQATPAVVPASQPADYYAYSNKRNDYTSTSSGAKIIIKWSSSFSVSGTDHWRIVVGERNYTSGVSTDTFARATWSDSGVGYANEVWGIGRLQLISADFDITAITWNGLAGLSLDATTFASGKYAQAQANISVTTPALTAIASMFVAPCVWDVYHGGGDPSLTCYGCLIDCAPNSDDDTTKITSIDAKLHFENVTTFQPHAMKYTYSA